MLSRSDRRLLEDSAERLCERLGGPRAHRSAAASGGFVPQRWAEMVEASWLSAALPSECDGLGLGVQGLAVLMRQAGRALITEPVAPAAAVMAAAALIAPHRLSELFPDGAGSATLVVPAMQDDPHGISHRRSSVTAASKGAGIVLRGVKRAVPFGSRAERLILTAMLDGEFLICVVDGAAEGLARSGRIGVDGMAFADVEFAGVPVPADRILERGPRAETFALALVSILNLATASELLGVARRAFEIGIDHLKSRRQFGRTLASFQALQHQAAWNHVDLSMSEALVEEAARALDGEQVWHKGFAAKAHATEAALSVTKSVIQYLGAAGFTEAHDAQLYLKRALTLASAYGTAPFLRGAFRELSSEARKRGDFP